MNNDNKDLEKPIAGHEYDGIQEFDNPLPGWWLVTFFGTIIFAFIYYIHFEVAGGPTLAQELNQSMAAIKALSSGGPVFTEESLAAAFNQDLVEQGSKLYAEKCAACHRDDLGGLIGPNLTDNTWIHGQGKRLDIANLIANGVPDKGMPAWKEQLSETDLVALTGFVFSKKGTPVANGKPAQGTEIKE